MLYMCVCLCVCEMGGERVWHGISKCEKKKRVREKKDIHRQRESSSIKT